MQVIIKERLTNLILTFSAVSDNEEISKTDTIFFSSLTYSYIS